jgi:hypothetical protein
MITTDFYVKKAQRKKHSEPLPTFKKISGIVHICMKFTNKKKIANRLTVSLCVSLIFLLATLDIFVNTFLLKLALMACLLFSHHKKPSRILNSL